MLLLVVTGIVTAKLEDIYTNEDDEFRDEKRAVDERVRNGNGAIYFVHVHKAGGTTVCTMAKMNKMRVPAVEKSKKWMGKNCNPRFADKQNAWLGSAEDLVQYSRREKFRFMAIEMILPPELAWGHFAYLGIVRDPLRLLVSNTGWRGKDPPNHHVLRYDNRMVQIYSSTVPGPTSNGGITGKHLSKAKERLCRFSLVLVTERLSEAGELLTSHFGWKLNNATQFRSGTHAKFNPLKVASEESMNVLRRKTIFDSQLYEFANSLFDRQLELLASAR